MDLHRTLQAPAPIIRGSTELLLIAADPIAQVKSPQAFNLLFAMAGVDAVVVPVHVAPAQLQAFVQAMAPLGNVRGLMFSIPHKTAVAALLDRSDAAVRITGSANALRRAADGALEGAQFDGLGLVRALGREGIDPSGQRVLLLGAGGAGLAIAGALCGAGLAELGVFDAAPARSAALAQRVRHCGGPAVSTLASNHPGGWDIVINATPLGLRADDPMPLEPQQLDVACSVFDILMTPHPSPLVQACRARGIRSCMGHEMLIQQLPAYLDYFGFAALADELQRDDHPAMEAARAAIMGGRRAP